MQRCMFNLLNQFLVDGHLYLYSFANKNNAAVDIPVHLLFGTCARVSVE